MHRDDISLPIWQVLQKQRPDTATRATPRPENAAGEGYLGVRCPRCGWKPRQEDRWACICAHVWNTFDTGGVCPGCKRAWTHTQCLRCHGWSRHDAWYVWEGGTGKSP